MCWPLQADSTLLQPLTDHFVQSTRCLFHCANALARELEKSPSGRRRSRCRWSKLTLVRARCSLSERSFLEAHGWRSRHRRDKPLPYTHMLKRKTGSRFAATTACSSRHFIRKLHSGSDSDIPEQLQHLQHLLSSLVVITLLPFPRVFLLTHFYHVSGASSLLFGLLVSLSSSGVSESEMYVCGETYQIFQVHVRSYCIQDKTQTTYGRGKGLGKIRKRLRNFSSTISVVWEL